MQHLRSCSASRETLASRCSPQGMPHTAPQAYMKTGEQGSRPFAGCCSLLSQALLLADVHSSRVTLHLAGIEAATTAEQAATGSAAYIGGPSTHLEGRADCIGGLEVDVMLHSRHCAHQAAAAGVGRSCGLHLHSHHMSHLSASISIHDKQQATVFFTSTHGMHSTAWIVLRSCEQVSAWAGAAWDPMTAGATGRLARQPALHSAHQGQTQGRQGRTRRLG